MSLAERLSVAHLERPWETSYDYGITSTYMDALWYEDMMEEVSRFADFGYPTYMPVKIWPIANEYNESLYLTRRKIGDALA